jgi:hypothetical protein
MSPFGRYEGKYKIDIAYILCFPVTYTFKNAELAAQYLYLGEPNIVGRLRKIRR